MYDDVELTGLMQDCGFAARVCMPRESELPDIERLEHSLEKWTAELLGKNLFVEGRK
jgi:hypothetical protein